MEMGEFGHVLDFLRANRHASIVRGFWNRSRNGKDHVYVQYHRSADLTETETDENNRPSGGGHQRRLDDGAVEKPLRERIAHQRRDSGTSTAKGTDGERLSLEGC